MIPIFSGICGSAVTGIFYVSHFALLELDIVYSLQIRHSESQKILLLLLFVYLLQKMEPDWVNRNIFL